MMQVKNISWMGPETDSDSADITITDGTFECIAFCYPCENIHVGDILNDPLYAFDVKNMMLSYETELGFWPIDSTGGYRIVGKLVDQRNNLVSIGGIKMDVGVSIPAGLIDGELIEFEVSRIDL